MKASQVHSCMHTGSSQLHTKWTSFSKHSIWKSGFVIVSIACEKHEATSTNWCVVTCTEVKPYYVHRPIIHFVLESPCLLSGRIGKALTQ